MKSTTHSARRVSKEAVGEGASIVRSDMLTGRLLHTGAGNLESLTLCAEEGGRDARQATLG